ncbi:hypothetical protein KKA66_03825, partial [Patescibacteria group bacterium]|nr:hypothetical protein [Patescibacteria group bacterium]
DRHRLIILWFQVDEFWQNLKHQDRFEFYQLPVFNFFACNFSSSTIKIFISFLLIFIFKIILLPSL